MNKFKMLSPLLLLVLLPGCRHGSANAPAADYFYLGPDNDLSNLGRVAIVELYDHSHYPQMGADVTEALFQALQKKQLFSLAVVNRNEPAWRGLQMDLDTTYTLDHLSAMRKTLQCNAVLVGAVTQYQPYPHLSLALRLKLVDLRSGQLMWALEQIWDTADKATENRIRQYFQQQMRSDYAPLGQELIAISSIKFIKFVAYEVGETLRRRLASADVLW
jgi:hypothetical protein